MSEIRQILRAGWEALRRDDLETANTLTKALLESTKTEEGIPWHAQALHFAGSTAQGLGDIDAAITYLEAALEHDPKTYAPLLRLAEVLQEDAEDHEAVIQLTADWLHRAEALPAALRAELHLRTGRSLSVLDSPLEAEAALAKATRLTPERGLAHSEHAASLFDLWRFDDAETAARRALSCDDGHAMAWQILAVVAERQGDSRASLEARRAALAADPLGRERRLVMDDETFSNIVTEEFSLLPGWLRELLGDVALGTERLPSEEMCKKADPPLSPAIVGVFVGHTRNERASVVGVDALPPQIFLFQDNLLRSVTDDEELRHEIRHTLLHEIGHYLGLDEVELYARGLE